MPSVVKGIITRGLGGDATAMILGKFNLGFLGIEIIIPPRPVGGGGSVSHGVFPDRTDVWDKDAARTIIIRIKYKKKTTEKIYLVSAVRTEFIIKVLNIVNITRDRIKISIRNLKHQTLKVFAKIKSFGTKDTD